MKFDEKTMKKLEEQVSEILHKRREEIYLEYLGTNMSRILLEEKRGLLDVLTMDLADVFERVGFRTRSFMLASGLRR